MIRDYKTIVFFGGKNPHYSAVKEDFLEIQMIKVFQTPHMDELDQILKQSQASAILTHELGDLNKFYQINLLGNKDAGIRLYFIDDTANLTKQQIMDLSYQKVSTLIQVPRTELKRKLDIFLLGKFQLSGGWNTAPASEMKISAADNQRDLKPAYFTHFKQIDGKWCVIVSTHEQEQEIETLFGRSWSCFCFELLTRASHILRPEHDPYFGDSYHLIIFPHLYSDGRKALSVIHLYKEDPDFGLKCKKALDFLGNI